MPRYIDAEKIKYTEYINGDVTVSKDLVEKIPTADVQEVRYGEWIESDYGICHCSECWLRAKKRNRLDFDYYIKDSLRAEMEKPR